MEMPLFSRETNHHTITYYTYKSGAAEHVSSHRFCLLIFPATFNLFHLLAVALPILCFMAEGPSHDPIVTNPLADKDTEDDSGAESVTTMTSSLTHGAALMAKSEISELSDFFKKTYVTEPPQKGVRRQDQLERFSVK
jgi:hypothetical protein